MTRRKVTLDALMTRHRPGDRAVRRWLWRHGNLATWLLNPQERREPSRGSTHDAR